MGHADFIHLRVHSAYSLSEGALRHQQILKFCRENTMPAVAVSDSCNLFGALEFAVAAAAAGVQPIIGCQLNLRAAGSDNNTVGSGNGRLDANFSREGLAPDHLALYVQDAAGYRNLLRLISDAYLETAAGEAPQVSLEQLGEHTDGLIALTGGPSGSVGKLLREGSP